jgi:hypothetical protein
MPFSFVNSDIDVVMQTKYVVTPADEKRALFQLRNLLLRDGIAKEAFVITRARHLVMNVVSSDETGACTSHRLVEHLIHR